MAGKINATQLHEKALIKVAGTVQYSRIGSPIAGDELKRSDERRTARGGIAIGREHTTLTLRDPRIIPESGDPNNLSIDELYVQERFYKNTNDPNTYFYSIINRGEILPDIYAVRQDDKTKVDKVAMDGKELAAGLRVVVLIQVYKSKSYNNKGTGIKLITVQEPMRYRDPGATSNAEALKAMGLTTTGDVITANENNVVAPTDDPARPVDPVADPAPGNQFNSQPVQEEPWLCVCGQTNPASQKFCGNCGKPKSSAVQPGVGNPYANQQPAGIRYDPNSPDRNY